MMQKKQNTRRSLRDSIAKIYGAGIFVNAGFIVGFDSEKGSIAAGMIDCVEDTAIPVCMVGLLYALPNTQLTRRLASEGRLFAEPDPLSGEGPADQCTAGLNFETSRPRPDVLADYKAVLGAIYEPAAYFGRARRLGRLLKRKKRRLKQTLPMILRDLRTVCRLSWRMSTAGRQVRTQFWRTLFDCLVHNPRALPYLVMQIALYLHLGPFAGHVVRQIERQIADLASGRSPAPQPMRIEAAERLIA
jgi:hypothetical protein